MLKAVDIKEIAGWDGRDNKTYWIGDFSIKFFYFDTTEIKASGVSTNDDVSLLRELELQIQQVADVQFGLGQTKITSKIKRTSLEIIVTLSAVLVATYKFFKDYEDFRNGIIAFLGDIKKMSYRLHNIVRKHLGYPKKKIFDEELRLVSSYYYNHIREIAHSEKKAVEQMMDLVGKWGALLGYHGDMDDDIQSDVSSRDAEHAMKDAVAALVFLVKKRFVQLSEEEKIQEFMCLYPYMAVLFLNKEAFSWDSNQKIDEILNDPGNEPFFEQLEAWLRTHRIFGKSPEKQKQIIETAYDKHKNTLKRDHSH